MKEELASMRGANMFGSFYSSLKGINEYYHKYPHILQLEETPVEIPPFEVFSIHIFAKSFSNSFSNSLFYFF